MNGFISTSSETVFMNRLVYVRSEKDVESRVRLLVSELELDRDMSSLVGVAKSVKLVTFPRSIKEVRCRTFKSNRLLKSAVLNEGLERLEGLCDDQ